MRKPRAWVAPYVALWLLVGLLPIQPTDLDLFFWPSAGKAADGQPLLAYEPRGQNDYPNANGPTSLVPLTAVALVVKRLGWWNDWDRRRVLALGFFSLFLVLMAREAVAAIDRLRGRPLQGIWRLLAYGALTLAPPIWEAVAGYGHIEQPIEVWLLLVAARWLEQGWVARAGLALGLSALTRSAAGLMALPLALAALRKGPTSLVRLVSAAAATGIAGLLPFYLADRSDLVHSLFTYRGKLPIGAGSIWNLATDQGAISFIQHWDILFVMAGALLANAWLATRPGGFTEERVLGGMAITAVSFALFTKTVWPYYFFEAFVLLTVWTAGRWRPSDGIVRLLLAPVAISIFAIIANIAATPGLVHQVLAVEGGGMFVMLGLVAVWLLWIASGQPPKPLNAGGSQAGY
jgi:hypothetical protein